MKNGRTLTLNDKGMLLIALTIFILTFALGFMSSKKVSEPEVTTFTREELDRIVELQQLEDDRESGAEICAYKDEDGNLMIGWNYGKSKWK